MAASKENPLVDTGNVTVSAYNKIKSYEKALDTSLLSEKNIEKNLNNKVDVYVYTPQDKQEHRYFHSLSIDKQVEDFMGTAELKCPYDSDLMEYWEPIRNYCVIYGSNHGPANKKILFIGRVRELKQEGYELVITFQDYGWKFKQLVTQSYANDNVINKDGYTIMKLMFAALKIDSWVISPTAKYRLKQVGFDKDGNVTLNKKEIKEMPDLLKRLKKSDPNKAINKWTVYNKIKESEEHNTKNINYTLKYEKPTKVMKKIASEGSKSGGFSPGTSIYGTNYGASSSGTGSSSDPNSPGGANVSASGNPRPPADLCSYIGNSSVIAAMKVCWSYNRGYANDYSSAQSTVVNFARNSPQTYSSKVAPCLSTISKYVTRSDKVNSAARVKAAADDAARWSGLNKRVTNTAVSVTASALKFVGDRATKVAQNVKKGDWGGAVMAAIFG